MSTDRSTSVRLALLASAMLLPSLSSQAFAQAAADEGADSAEIVVTATRRAENIKDVPVAVTAIGGEKLAVINSSGLDIRFLSARTPSLQIESSFGRTFPRFYIRGLGNTDFDPNAAQPVSVVYDDVALENPMLKSFPVFDLASVEVLRGPQGTLFGRNTPAGVVKLNSAVMAASAGAPTTRSTPKPRSPARSARASTSALRDCCSVATTGLPTPPPRPSPTASSKAIATSPAGSSWAMNRAGSAPFSTSMGATSTARRASSAPASFDRAATASQRASRRTGFRSTG